MKKKNENNKIIFARIMLIVLILIGCVVSYIKFFNKSNENLEEKPINSEKSKELDLALDEIVNNFNNNNKIADYEKNNIKLKAIRKNNSIFISYITESETITYEFIYNNSYLIITVNNSIENIERFKNVFYLITVANQERLGVTNDNISDMITNFFENDTEYKEITVDKSDDKNTYYIEFNSKIDNTNATNNINNSKEEE